MSLFRTTSKIDKLADQKKNLVIEKEKLVRDMRARNSKRDTQLKIITNEGQNDYDETMKKVSELDRKLNKILRDIESEKMYVNEVADAEKEDYEAKVEEDRKTKAKAKEWAK